MACNKFFCSKYGSSLISLPVPLLHCQDAIYCNFDFAPSTSTDYNFQDMGHDFLQKLSTLTALDDYLSFNIDCENPKKLLSGSS